MRNPFKNWFKKSNEVEKLQAEVDALSLKFDLFQKATNDRLLEIDKQVGIAKANVIEQKRADEIARKKKWLNGMPDETQKNPTKGAV